MAWRALKTVLAKGRPLDTVFDEAAGRDIDSRDLALARMIAATALRRKCQIDTVIAATLDRPLPKRAKLPGILLGMASAELMFLDTPSHAVVNDAVAIANKEPDLRPYRGLTNAVLRKIAAREGPPDAEPGDNLPAWLLGRWRETYGAEVARSMALVLSLPPPLDISLAVDPEEWAERLGGTLLPAGSIRLDETAHIPDLPGFNDGTWWVQGAGAALPARLLRPRPGMTVIDLCAAPGGKTLQLAAAGADVTAIDVSAARLERLSENLARTGLTADIIAADVNRWRPDAPVDAVLLDAPCSATGTVHRHPDAPYLKTAGQIEKLASLQDRMLDAAAALVRPGGTLVYCTCSLEPEEGEERARAFIERHGAFSVDPVTPVETGGMAELITAEGWLRTRPDHLAECGGLEGFFAARFTHT